MLCARVGALALAFRGHAGCLGFLDSARLQQSCARAVAQEPSVAFGGIQHSQRTGEAPETRLARAHALGAIRSTGEGELCCVEAAPQGSAPFPW